LSTRWVFLSLFTLFAGVIAGSLLAPQPAVAVSREIIQLQTQVQQLIQGQQDLRSALEAKTGAMTSMLNQTLESVNKLNNTMGSLQKSIQDVQANSGSRIDTLTSQVQGMSDNLQDIQARVAKVSQQLTDTQNVLQSIDAKISSGTPTSGGAGSSPTAPGSGQPTMSGPPVSAQTLYQNALHDYTSGKYDLSRQEFSDYIKNFPNDDLASNAQFYLGEIAYTQADFPAAIKQYDSVLTNYPKSYKLASSLLKKAMAELELGQKATGMRDLREVVRRFPGTDESRRAQAKLRETSPTHR